MRKKKQSPFDIYIKERGNKKDDGERERTHSSTHNLRLFLVVLFVVSGCGAGSRTAIATTG